MDSDDGNCFQMMSDDQEDEMGMEELRRGPWTVEEDLTLINYISLHGEGRWNSLARSADLKRTGKSCRLRWLNYLRPDVRRGNITLEEQLLILELHSRWGNRWSKIAQYLPGRTDNEIKNYWRTRVQKHAKQLKCDVNSKQFKDAMRYLWMPRLVERIQAASATSGATAAGSPGGSTSTITTMTGGGRAFDNNLESIGSFSNMVPENLGASVSSPISELTNYYHFPANEASDPADYFCSGQMSNYQFEQSLAGLSEGYYSNYGLDFQPMDQSNNYQYVDGGETSDNLWNAENIWDTNYDI
ncbi:hypothetical protein SAY86_030964 [Trapa natans]|uniref:Uncharacterized protein n=1 Tax=Trapa natans TaxID=22666 RepID=A0AAN7MTG1_TRANT|nr:hypothetical protein SAY86_030964 [Trapa natans]